MSNLDLASSSRASTSSPAIAHWRRSPPYHGFTHTVLLLGRNLLIISDERHIGGLYILEMTL